ncbi:hypothetical protein F4782DRAFT_496786 [Xylaria castorea]|nr:hypothetical protein F4782DRAFT_496786 [Xylaria castorea]
MDSTDAGTTPHSLEKARVVPIAELSPDLPEPTTTAVGGVVTITWPYNKVKGTFAFSLAEPNFRLRRNKGQVRIEFTGRAAKVVGDCGLGSNDEVLLSLAGAAWETDVSNKRRSLPGADLGWRLIFSESLLLKIKRAETSETDLIVVDEQPNQHETAPDPTPIQSSTMTESPSPPAPFSPIHIISPVREISRKRFNDSEFDSPAFVKRARMSYGSLFEDGFDIFQENSGAEGQRRKRTKFGRDSNAWRYMSHSPSPEPAAASPEKAAEQVSSPSRVVSSPTKVEMVDEGCQAMELDRSSPQPASASLVTHTDMTMSEHLTVNDATSDEPTEVVIERTQMPPSNDLPSEIRAQIASAPDYGEVPDPEVNAPQPYSDQQVSPPRNSFADNPWNVDIVPSAFEQQHKAPFPPLHVDASLALSDFGNITAGNQPILFEESDGLNELHVGDGENQETINDGIIPSTELHPPAFNYPPLDPIEDTHPQPIHDEALTNYPASYLEDSRTSSPNQMMEEQTAQKPAVAELGASSWATVNQISNATAMPPTDRLGSRDGSTPEQALVIDESDSDSESSPEPMAVEDTLNNGRAYALDMYEDAEAEDDVDAQYSDDDEPEYDANEMGGDYDTRNYERPDDDDDGGYDEDPRPQHLEPEFDEGESWDEEEQEEFLDEEDEGEYESDEDVPEPRPQPVVRANPTVIDLISSSEDESEDEDEDEDAREDGTTTGIQGSGAHIDSRVSPSPQKTISEDDSRQAYLNDDDSEIVSQAPMSEADNSSKAGAEDDEYTSSYREEKVEGGENRQNREDPKNEENEDEDNDDAEVGDQEEGIGEKIESESYEREEVNTFELPEHQAEQHPEQKINSERETEPEGDTILGGMDDIEDTLSHQTISRTEILESAATGNRREEDTATEPLSAADGLELLSRAVDKESRARGHGLFAETLVEKVVMESISDEQSSTEPPGQDDVQMQDLLDSQLNAALEAVLEEVSVQDNGENQVDQIALSKSDTEYPPFVISRREPSAAAPSSPPPTQSFQSLIEGDNKSIFEETTITSTTQIATAQLPTPLDTQVTDTTLNASINFHMTMEESFDSYTTIEQQDPKTTEISVSEESIDNPARQDINMEANGSKQGHESTLIVELEARKPTREPSIASSPTPSFRTQVGNEELAWSESEEEQIKIDSQLNQGLSPDPSSDESDINKSFTSHVDIDEELQASILENSLLEEYSSDDVHDELDEPNQIDTNEASWESERIGQAEIPSSSLHDNTPAKQLAEEISTQLRRNFVTNSSISGEDSDTSMLNDPSVHLARVANASKRTKRKGASSNHLHYPRRRTLDIRRSPTPDTDNSSIQLARVSLSSQTPKSEEDSPSMTAAKLQLSRHLRDELPDFCLLESLRQHVTKSLDVIAVAAMKPPNPRRAKGGPREYMMSFMISDYSIGPYNVAEAFIYRPHKDSLPVIKYGDVVLFRNFTVVSLAGKGFGLRSNDGSSWAVFDYEDEPAQVRGPPVEYIQREVTYVNYLREWFNLLDVKARARLERANQDFIKSK